MGELGEAEVEAVREEAVLAGERVDGSGLSIGLHPPVVSSYLHRVLEAV